MSSSESYLDDLLNKINDAPKRAVNTHAFDAAPAPVVVKADTKLPDPPSAFDDKVINIPKEPPLPRRNVVTSSLSMDDLKLMLSEMKGEPVPPPDYEPTNFFENNLPDIETFDETVEDIPETIEAVEDMEAVEADEVVETVDTVDTVDTVETIEAADPEENFETFDDLAAAETEEIFDAADDLAAAETEEIFDAADDLAAVETEESFETFDDLAAVEPEEIFEAADDLAAETEELIESDLSLSEPFILPADEVIAEDFAEESSIAEPFITESSDPNAKMSDADIAALFGSVSADVSGEELDTAEVTSEAETDFDADSALETDIEVNADEIPEPFIAAPADPNAKMSDDDIAALFGAVGADVNGEELDTAEVTSEAETDFDADSALETDIEVNADEIQEPFIAPPADPNAKMSDDDIAALFGSVNDVADDTADLTPADPAPADPNAKMSDDDIAALFGSVNDVADDIADSAPADPAPADPNAKMSDDDIAALFGAVNDNAEAETSEPLAEEGFDGIALEDELQAEAFDEELSPETEPDSEDISALAEDDMDNIENMEDMNEGQGSDLNLDDLLADEHSENADSDSSEQSFSLDELDSLFNSESEDTKSEEIEKAADDDLLDLFSSMEIDTELADSGVDADSMAEIDNLLAADSSEENDKKGKSKKDKKDKKPLTLPPFIQNLFDKLTTAEEEPETDEAAPAAEGEAAEKKKKKSKKAKKGEEAESGEDSGDEEAKPKKQKKSKKEKKPKAAAEVEPEKDYKLTNKKIIRIFSVCIALGVLIAVCTIYLPYMQEISNAKDLYFTNDMKGAYQEFSGLKQNKSSKELYEKAAFIVALDRKYEAYLTYEKMGMELESLNALIEGIRISDSYHDKAEEMGLLSDWQTSRSRLQSALENRYMISVKQAQALYKYEDPSGYTAFLEALISGTPFEQLPVLGSEMAIAETVENLESRNPENGNAENTGEAPISDPLPGETDSEISQETPSNQNTESNQEPENIQNIGDISDTQAHIEEITIESRLTEVR